MSQQNSGLIRRRLGWLLALTLAILAVVVVGAGLLWVKSAQGFSATAPPTAMEAMMADMARRMAMPSQAAAMRNPLPTTPANLTMASQHFAAHCALCHNNNGDGLTDLGRDLYPKPPDLRAPLTQDKSDGELFYTIRNGIRLSGMPAWPDDENDEIWMLVSLIRHLPQQTPAEVEAMKAYNPKSIFPEPIM
ncbi:MAG TPA: c-type cytochrome [Terriglobales bacterium]|nr:c-type cytochrome [Terriglobales bacterium]